MRQHFADKSVPAFFFLAFSSLSHSVSSCLCVGFLPTARQWRLHFKISKIALMVGLPALNLFSTHVKGTLSWEWLEHGRFRVTKSKESWFMRPCTGTPSPCSPKGVISHVKLSQAEAAVASCLCLALPASGNASMKFSCVVKYTFSHSCGRRKGCQPSLACLVLRSQTGILAQYKWPHWLFRLCQFFKVLAALVSPLSEAAFSLAFASWAFVLAKAF